jgi:hypothetical protein
LLAAVLAMPPRRAPEFFQAQWYPQPCLRLDLSLAWHCLHPASANQRQQNSVAQGLGSSLAAAPAMRQCRAPEFSQEAWYLPLFLPPGLLLA